MEARIIETWTPNSTVHCRPWTIGRWVWLTYGDLTHQWLPSTQTWTPRSVFCRPPSLPLHDSRLQVWQLTYLDHESMVHVLGLQLWGEIRIPEVLGSNTKTSSLSYLARGTLRPPLTPLKDAQSKFKYTQAKPRCTCLPPSATSTQWEQWFIRKSTVRCWNIWGTLGNKKSQVIFKGRHLHYPIPSSLSKAAPGLWLFINVALLFTRAIDSCWKRCLMATCHTCKYKYTNTQIHKYKPPEAWKPIDMLYFWKALVTQGAKIWPLKVCSGGDILWK